MKTDRANIIGARSFSRVIHPVSLDDLMSFDDDHKSRPRRDGGRRDEVGDSPSPPRPPRGRRARPRAAGEGPRRSRSCGRCSGTRGSRRVRRTFLDARSGIFLSTYVNTVSFRGPLRRGARGRRHDRIRPEPSGGETRARVGDAPFVVAVAFGQFPRFPVGQIIKLPTCLLVAL